ncbi:MAG: rhamnogalacturonan acetylesterase [Bacteroidetes bacterium]|nr:rhamnogalacturonan acetylesterase [Bacteroidota bacterium]
MYSIKKFALLVTVIILYGFVQEKIPTIYLTGDSTIAEKLTEKKPETGWGEKLDLFLNGNIKIDNRARNGRSTRTFINEGRWQDIINNLNQGDYVLIQFGHNDQSKQKLDRYTPPDDFNNNLKKFVTETRSRNALPVLITPVVRRRFNDKGVFYDVHGEYPDLVRNVAEEFNVPLIDLHKKSKELLINLGEEKSKELFLILEPGKYVNYPSGLDDNTHFSEYGAEIVAGLIAQGINELNIDLKKYLKEEK